MSNSLRLFLRVTDSLMLAYWMLNVAACFKLVILPSDLMYEGYGTHHVDAWNWSFAPMDAVFALLGLWSIRLNSNNDPRWRLVCAISLTLTICAGGMAISYWAFAGEFNILWWLPNLLLIILPFIWLPNLILDTKSWN
jgi:Family of unknown function (DUF5360)